MRDHPRQACFSPMVERLAASTSKRDVHIAAAKWHASQTRGRGRPTPTMAELATF